MRLLQVRNWREFQHYGDRNPPWIKLHVALLDDYRFATLPDLEKGALPLIWLLASRNGGKIPDDAEFVQKRLGLSRKPNLELYVSAEFLIPSADQAPVAAQPSAKKERKPNGKHDFGDYMPTDELVEKLRARYGRTTAEMQNFYRELRDYCKRTGKQYIDYDAAYETAVRDAWGARK